MSDWVQELNERSKDDRAIIVGSEVRALVAEIATLRADLAAAREEVERWKMTADDLSNEREGLLNRALATERARDEALAALREISEAYPDEDETPQDYRKRIQYAARRALDDGGIR